MGEEGVMTALLTAATELLTWVLTSLGSILTTITAQPVLLIGIIISIVSVAFGFLFRTMNHS